MRLGVFERLPMPYVGHVCLGPPLMSYVAVLMGKKSRGLAATQRLIRAARVHPGLLRDQAGDGRFLTSASQPARVRSETRAPQAGKSLAGRAWTPRWNYLMRASGTRQILRLLSAAVGGHAPPVMLTERRPFVQNVSADPPLSCAMDEDGLSPPRKEKFGRAAYLY